MPRLVAAAGLVLLLAVVGAVPAGAAGSAGMPWTGPAVDVERLAILHDQAGFHVFDSLRLANPHDAPLSAIELPLFPGAANVRLRQGAASPVIQGDRLLLNLSIEPRGHADLAFTYDLPGRALPVRLERAVTMPTATLLVLVRDDQLSLRSAGFADLGVQSVNGLAVHQYGIEGLPPGTALSLLAGPPLSWWERLDQRLTPRVWLAIGSVLLAGMLLYGWRREVKPA